MFKVAYITSSRADYGIVRNFLKLLNEDEEINLEIIVTGSLLEAKYGNGYKIIEEDGFNISKKVSLKLTATDNESIINSMSVALKEFGSFFAQNKYDLVIILGDRYEMLSVATAAAMYGLKILHLHGGEITLGNYDEFIRHSITKMSMYHFTSTEEYRKRVIQLGENPSRVYNVGAMGSENCKKIDMAKVESKILDLKNEKYFVVLFHPETLTASKPEDQIKILLGVIKEYINDYKFIFIGSNSDTGSDEIKKQIKNFVKQNSNAIYFENTHPDSFHFLLKNSIALIGNSSAGIIEAPSFGCYTINIGDRQKGRVRGNSVIDVKCDDRMISNEIDKMIKLDKSTKFDNPYYKRSSSKNAYKITKEILKKNNGNLKEFYDLK